MFAINHKLITVSFDFVTGKTTSDVRRFVKTPIPKYHVVVSIFAMSMANILYALAHRFDGSKGSMTILKVFLSRREVIESLPSFSLYFLFCFVFIGIVNICERFGHRCFGASVGSRKGGKLLYGQ